jgi:hypothetical protein
MPRARAPLPLPLDEEKLAAAVCILGGWCDPTIAKQLKFGGEAALRHAAEAVIRAYVGYEYPPAAPAVAPDPSAELRKKNARLRKRLAFAEEDCRRAQARRVDTLVLEAKCVQLRDENERLKALLSTAP